MIIDTTAFEETSEYFENSLKLIVYAYEQIKKDKAKEPYSREKIHDTIRTERNSEKSLKEFEDYLRNDMVTHYLTLHQRKFSLKHCSIQPGRDMLRNNVSIGRIDIYFEPYCNNSAERVYYAFECKRLNKYSQSIAGYIEEGMMCFVRRQYYAESNITLAGMIAFVEVDREKHKQGYLPVDKLAEVLGNKIKEEKERLKTTQELASYSLDDENYPEVSRFRYSYLSKHIRDGDGAEISIHHLLLDYYDILVP